MSFRVTRNTDRTITAESDRPGNEVDHVYAQRHSRELEHYMQETGQDRIEGRDYDDVVNRIVDEENKRDGYSPTTRMAVSGKLVW